MVHPVVIRRSRQAETFLVERRRAGRAMVPFPSLLPLLRGDFDRGTQSAEDTRVYDAEDSAPAHGILVALLLTLPLWGAIGGAVWAAVRIVTTILGSEVASRLATEILGGGN
jgi:hypothetical protein